MRRRPNSNPSSQFDIIIDRDNTPIIPNNSSAAALAVVSQKLDSHNIMAVYSFVYGRYSLLLSLLLLLFLGYFSSPLTHTVTILYLVFSNDGELFNPGQFLLSISPYLFASLGTCLCVGFSVIGAAWGIMITGASLLGAAVRAPRYIILQLNTPGFSKLSKIKNTHKESNKCHLL